MLQICGVSRRLKLRRNIFFKPILTPYLCTSLSQYLFHISTSNTDVTLRSLSGGTWWGSARESHLFTVQRILIIKERKATCRPKKVHNCVEYLMFRVGMRCVNFSSFPEWLYILQICFQQYVQIKSSHRMTNFSEKETHPIPPPHNVYPRNRRRICIRDRTCFIIKILKLFYEPGEFLGTTTQHLLFY